MGDGAGDEIGLRERVPVAMSDAKADDDLELRDRAS